ncbi:maleylpyruvate isomerase N-terminal domain-containing protein [Kineosporia sp. A_224]|uniref:maleylpyruvate isomerase N-terminal domain-containing protein n=1 Tax=Kineosporia sp. A_224 TaxID=1962180 RepID=UPI000B4B4627|nr:maleylpyruvate isomerase N-terminal domain-containing protein [Kineosporia sp. A_224]
MADRVPLSLLYREARERIGALVPGIPDDSLPVPATPGWTVHDVVAHLAGAAQDGASGNGPTDGPTPEWTATHVERGRGVPTAELLERWATASVAVEALLETVPIWPFVFDATTHEHDLRGAVGDTGARDSVGVVLGAKLLLGALDVPAPLRVVTGTHDVRVGPQAPDDERTVLRTTDFDAFRWRMGRRSAAQLAAMDWSGDPAPFLDHLCVFGPAATDVVE